MKDWIEIKLRHAIEADDLRAAQYWFGLLYEQLHGSGNGINEKRCLLC